MMTGTQIVAMALANLQVDLDYKGVVDLTSFPSALPYLNWAIRTISIQIKQLDPSIAMTLVLDQDTYQLRNTAQFSRKVLRVYRVIINGNPLLTARGMDYGLWSYDELERKRANWRIDPEGVPVRAVPFGQSLILNPKPSQAVLDAGGNYVMGTYLAADMLSSDGANSPDLPEELHEALAYLIAVRASMPNVTEDEGWKRLQSYSSEWSGMAEALRMENQRLIDSWGTTTATHYDTEIWL